MKLKPIYIDELERLIRISYENDHDLFDKYHVKKFGLEQSISCTMEMIREMGELKDMRHYTVRYRGMDIGYVSTFENYLYSYAIAIPFRKKGILIKWWSCVEQLMGTPFITGLYNNNTRAIDFLIKNGMQIVSKTEDKITFLKQ